MAEKAVERKTGARGLRSILEDILLDTMFELPELEGVEEVVINREVAQEGGGRYIFILIGATTWTTALRATSCKFIGET